MRSVFHVCASETTDEPTSRTLLGSPNQASSNAQTAATPATPIIAERLKNGEDFATVAKEVSKDANAEGGDLGLLTRRQMLKPFDDAALALDVGQISTPVQTQFGWRIVKVEEKRDQPLPTFDQVKDAIVGPARRQQKARGGRHRVAQRGEDRVVDPELEKSMDDAAAQATARPRVRDDTSRRRRRL